MNGFCQPQKVLPNRCLPNPNKLLNMKGFPITVVHQWKSTRAFSTGKGPRGCKQCLLCDLFAVLLTLHGFSAFQSPTLTTHICVPAHICLPIRFTFPWTSRAIIFQVLSKNVFIFHWEPGQCCSVRIKKRIKGSGNRMWTCLCMCVGRWAAVSHLGMDTSCRYRCQPAGVLAREDKHCDTKHKPCTVLS